uniref:Lipoprotein n=1 Tax=Anopheles dirus TaxID=7168 RepID=A0A182NLS0_9DIPT
MIKTVHRLFILIYLLCAGCRVAYQQPVEQPMVTLVNPEKDTIPPIYNTPPQPPVKILRETRPITEKESMQQMSDDLQQSESYTYSYYRPVYYPGVYYSYYPRYRWYRPYYDYNWWYY